MITIRHVLSSLDCGGDFAIGAGSTYCTCDGLPQPRPVHLCAKSDFLSTQRIQKHIVVACLDEPHCQRPSIGSIAPLE